MIQKLDLNNNIKWVSYNEYIKFQIEIIKANKKNLNNNGINDYIKYLIDLDEEKDIDEYKSEISDNKKIIQTEIKKSEDEINEDSIISENF